MKTKADEEAQRLERNAASLRWKQSHATRVAQFNRAWQLNRKDELTPKQKQELRKINKALGRS